MTAPSSISLTYRKQSRPCGIIFSRSYGSSIITLEFRSRVAVRDHLSVWVVTVPSPITLTYGNSARQMGSSTASASRPSPVI
jgi:hypothetical protein